MDRFEKFLADRQIADRILPILEREAGQLPKEGIVAGQAVSSAIDELLGQGVAVYNDVDLFLNRAQWSQQTGEESFEDITRFMHSERVNFYKEEALVADDYQGICCVARRQHYTIEKSRSAGKVNQILVEWAYPIHRQPKSKAKALVDVFDLNGVKVGLDLATGELKYSTEYLQYLKTRELKVAETFTPFQSLLRYLKKRRELGVYGHDLGHVDMTLQLLKANEFDPALIDLRKNAFLEGRRLIEPKEVKKLQDKLSDGRKLSSQWLRVGTGIKNAPLVVGAKYKKLFDEFAPLLAPYFELTAHPKLSLWLLSCRDGPGASMPSQKWSSLYRPELQGGQRYVKRYWEEALAPNKLKMQRRANFSWFVEQLTEESAKSQYAHAFRLEGDAYLEGAESLSNLTQLLKVVNEHAEFSNTCVALSLKQQIGLMKVSKAAFKRHKVDELWGLYRSLRSDIVSAWLEDPSLIDSHITRAIGAKHPLYEGRLPLPSDRGGVTIQELASPYELYREGNQMRHCVGGYSYALETNRSRIISFREGDTKRSWATAEWGIREAKELPAFEAGNDYEVRPFQLSCIQLRSFANEAPTPTLSALEKVLREEVNAYLRENPEESWRLFRPGILEAYREKGRSAPLPRGKMLKAELDDDFF